MSYSWTNDCTAEGLIIGCLRKGLIGRPRQTSFGDWPREAELPGRDLLTYLLDTEKAHRCNDSVVLSHAAVAGLDDEQAALLNLPPPIPYAIGLKSHGRLDQPEFAIEVRWLRYGTSPVHVRRTGAVAEDADRRYRLPATLLNIVEAVEAFSAADTHERDARIAKWLPIQEALEAATGALINPDGYLEDLRIFHASSLGLSVDIDADNGVTFDPVLFGRSSVRQQQGELFDEDPFADPAAYEEAESSVEGLDTLADEADSLLPPALNETFLRRRFDRDERCRSAYPLERNTYVVLDEPLRKALDVVKAKQGASSDERRAFLKNPRSAFASALQLEDDAPILRRLFVETEQFAERVTGIGVWQPKVLPWLPTTTNDWLPEKIGFTIDGRNVEVAPERLPELKKACEQALAGDKPNFKLPGIGELPANEETLSAIDRLAETAAQMERERGESRPAEEAPSEASDDEKPSARIALEEEDNLEELSYMLNLSPRASDLASEPPSGLIDPHRLFPHQLEGFEWMLKGWRSGRPGVLLADDMGLGKTVQTLAFACWLHAHYEQAQGGKRGPILIVAPTALLKNWRAEHDTHLKGGGFGPIIELYGGAVRSFRKPGETRRDVEVGRAVLDRESLGGASCILTTYETVANYHISLAGMRFPLVVFDEIQKLKTPTTINTHAAKTLNADYVVGLTGTPVENRLSDLWSIADRLHPGLLSDLRSFSRDYRADDVPSLRSLHELLVKPDPASTFMLRRMKDATDLGKALPPRSFEELVRDMPDAQAKAYASCIAEARREREAGADRGMMLKVLHRLRGISLHPEHPAKVLGSPREYEPYVAKSARLSVAIETLDRLYKGGKKALVFIEFLEMQDLFAEIVRTRYDLSRRPAIINGQTPSARRHQLVSEFQTRPPGQFDIMILSPRAAGVGLTITAATNVIHLSRWWNPAVEDQCNDRAYRIGQDKEVTVYLPIARHPNFGDASFDVRLNGLLERKRALSRGLLVPTESESDYQEMFDGTVS